MKDGLDRTGKKNRYHPQKEERVWYTSSAFWGAQDAAGHVIVMTTHRIGMATHQRLSHAAIGGLLHKAAVWRKALWPMALWPYAKLLNNAHSRSAEY